MALLPSGYIVCDRIEGCYDTGVLSASDLEIEALGYMGFGARNTNSNTSAGQYYVTGHSPLYFGYNSTRSSVGNVSGSSVQYSLIGGYAEINTPKKTISVTKTEATFTGTKNMYVGGYNNGGTASGTGEICGFILRKGGALTRDYVPFYKSANGTYGLYDLVNSSEATVVTSNTYPFKKLTVTATLGGTAAVRTYHGEDVDEIMFADLGSGTSAQKLVAYPDTGYVFESWTSGGAVLSNEETYLYTPSSSNVTVTANFKKKTAVLNMGYTATIIPNAATRMKNCLYVEVLNASIEEDILQKCTSKFVLKDVPSAIAEGQYFVLRTPRNEEIYFGIISAINGDTIECREILSFFDQDYILRTTSISANTSVLYGLSLLLMYGKYKRELLSTADTDHLLSRKGQNISFDEDIFEPRMNLRRADNSTVTFPAITESAIQNLEDLVLSYGSFGIYVQAFRNRSTPYIDLDPVYWKENDRVTISNNVEVITNLDVFLESTENTILVLYNAAGTTLRGMYGVMLDGSIGRYDTAGDRTQFLGYTNYVGKVVMSDDSLSTILAENLSTSSLSHKITFNLQPSDLLPFEKLQLGTPVDFYFDDKLYKSVITARSYEIQPNIEQIMSVKLTLGNVRTTLTSKLNLKKK